MIEAIKRVDAEARHRRAVWYGSVGTAFAGPLLPPEDIEARRAQAQRALLEDYVRGVDVKMP